MICRRRRRCCSVQLGCFDLGTGVNSERPPPYCPSDP
jgi:hypothetical protein